MTAAPWWEVRIAELEREVEELRSQVERSVETSVWVSTGGASEVSTS